MKNLKKVLAVALVVVMIAITMVPAFAADSFSYGTQATTLNTLGLFEGTTTGTFTPDLGGTVTREQGIIIILKLLGKKADAEKMTDADAAAALAKYTDKADISSWATKYVAYAVKNGLVSGMSDTTMAPQLQMQGKMFATILLKNLGYNTDGKYDTACATLQEKGGLTAAQATLFNDKPLIRDDVVGIAFGSLQAQYATGNTTIIGTLVSTGVVDAAKATSAYVYTAPTKAPAATPVLPADLTVKVSNSSAILVTLPVVPADTTKVVATVKRGGVAVTLTPTFSADKTQMTLTSSTKLLSGDYSVNVKNDTTDLGTKTVTVDTEKVGAISIDSNVLVRTSDSVGYAKFTVKNQYGEDVTNSTLGSITVTSSLQTPGTSPDVNKTSKTIKVTKTASTPGQTLDALKDFKQVTITAFDSSSGVSVTKTLDISSKIGDIASLTLKGISNADGKTTIYANTTDTFYIDYEAKDSQGNLITNYDILYNAIDADGVATPASGILLSGNAGLASASVVTDANDTNKAKIKLTIGGSDTLYGLVTLTAVCPDSGISSNITIDVKKTATSVDSVTLSLPSQEVAIGDKVEIPFTAVDITGAPLTKYLDLKDKVSFSPSELALSQGANGVAKLYFDATRFTSTQTGNQSLSATVSSTGKVSTVSMNVRAAGAPTKISALSTTAILNTTPNAYVEVPVVNVTVKDGYDRTIDLKNKTNQYGTDYYYVYVTSNSSAIVIDQPRMLGVGTAMNITQADATASATAPYPLAAPSIDNNRLLYHGSSTVFGTATLTFKLYKSSDTTLDISNDTPIPGSEKTIDVTNYDLKDISSYAFDAIPQLYAAPSSSASKANVTGASVVSSAYGYGTTALTTNSNTEAGGITIPAQLFEYSADAKVFGYTSTNKKVQIANSKIVGFTVSDPSKFVVTNPVLNAYAAKVMAEAYANSNDTTASATLTVSVKGANDVIYTATSPLTSSNAMPQAASIAVSLGDTGAAAAVVATRTFNAEGDIYVAQVAGFTGLTGKSITKWNCTTGVNDRAKIFFNIVDQYGKTALVPETITVSNNGVPMTIAGANSTSGATLSITNGIVTVTGTPATGDTWTISATSNGKSVQMVIRVKA